MPGNIVHFLIFTDWDSQPNSMAQYHNQLWKLSLLFILSKIFHHKTQEDHTTIIFGKETLFWYPKYIYYVDSDLFFGSINLSVVSLYLRARLVICTGDISAPWRHVMMALPSQRAFWLRWARKKVFRAHKSAPVSVAWRVHRDSDHREYWDIAKSEHTTHHFREIVRVFTMSSSRAVVAIVYVIFAIGRSQKWPTTFCKIMLEQV